MSGAFGHHDMLRPLHGPPAASPTQLPIAQIGVGRWGRNLLRVLSSLPHARLAIACDCDASALRGLPHTVAAETDSRRVLDDPSVQAVVIATPPSTHVPLTLAALSAGKHVFVEKPMALCVDDALTIRRAAQQTERRVMVGYILHHHPSVLALLERAQAGDLGRVHSIRASRLGGRGADSALHPAWWSLAPHDISVALVLLGQRATWVRAQRARSGEITARVEFEQGAALDMEIDIRTQRRNRSVVVYGSDALAVFDDDHPTVKLRLHAAHAPLVPGAPCAAETFNVTAAQTEPLLLELSHFVDCLQQGTPFRTGIDHALDVISVLAAGERSMASGGVAEDVVDWRPRPSHHAAASRSSLSSSSYRP